MMFRDKVIDDLTIWIKDNIHQRIKVNDVVVRSGYSKWHLQKIFHEVMNKNLGTYIRDLKLLHAAYDLVYSNEAIISISQKYGYDSQASFSRSFSKYYLYPPSEFRIICRIKSTC